MGQVNFYHLTYSAPEQVVSNLAARAIEQGWKIELRGRDLARLDQLDLRLWQMGEASFLPHGKAGGPHDGLQPLLLTTFPAGDARDALMALDGAEVSAADTETHKRVWILFDGNDAQALNVARGQWRALTGAGAKAAYWSEESGRWEKKAES
ncbi:DNA polymerase III subunit chi [Thioclava sp. 15-R06ZXC-3]|uniref:DNA polymerase III subunit chi n=1 Tax=Thioclava arctica TaxID=3238301 RepID=A0ABV3TM78_9RHOB